ncbi:CYTH domain-containing protein [Litchfieldella rifensis]|uniref:CYTH domain-containing protein n=1 Tax=Litchfieldella rifensis TaxID=762643 RepID=A0ABV7LUC7_9GAMM
MSQEIELKLALADSGPQRLASHPLLADRAPRITRLRNTYFDTPEATLEQAKVALRIRHTPCVRLQTLKTSGEGRGGLSIRGEWEWPIDGDELDLKGLAELPPMRDLGPETFVRLAPRFVTDFQRQTWDLEVAGSRIELALDSGEIRAGERQAAINEIELELKDGPSEPLWNVAEQLAQRVPLRPANTSKAARGSALLAGHWSLEQPDADAEAHVEHTIAALDAYADSGDSRFKTQACQALEHLAALGDDRASPRSRELAASLADHLTRPDWLTLTFGQAFLGLARSVHQGDQ